MADITSAIPTSLASYIEDQSKQARTHHTTATMFDPVQGPALVWIGLRCRMLVRLGWRTLLVRLGGRGSRGRGRCRHAPKLPNLKIASTSRESTLAPRCAPSPKRRSINPHRGARVLSRLVLAILRLGSLGACLGGLFAGVGITRLTFTQGHEQYIVPFHGYHAPLGALVMSAIPTSLGVVGACLFGLVFDVGC
jgi:hypothetical protein